MDKKQIQDGLVASYCGDAAWFEYVAGAPRMPANEATKDRLRAQGVPEDVVTVAVSYYGETAIERFDFPYANLGGDTPRSLLAAGPRGLMMLRSELMSLWP